MKKILYSLIIVLNCAWWEHTNTKIEDNGSEEIDETLEDEFKIA